MSPEEKGRAYLHPGEGRSVWLVDDLVTVKLASEDTGGAYSLMEVRTQPGGGPPPHAHRNHDEAIYVLEGDVELSVGESSLPAGAGSCVYAPRGTLHAWRNVGAAPSRVLTVITPGGLEGFFLEAGEPATDASSPPPGPPDIEKVMAVAAKYGVEIPPPPDQ
jgi:quercetin dioxygenase-like cupin family protein